MAKIKINQEELDNIGEEDKPSKRDLFTLWLKRNAIIVSSVLILITTVFIVLSYLDTQKQNKMAEATNTYDEIVQQLINVRTTTTWASDERISAMEEVIAKADELIAQYPDSDAAREALFLKGTAYYQMGDEVADAVVGGGANNQLAIDTLNEYYAAVPENSIERAKAALALAYASENKLFFDNQPQSATDAINYYSEAEAADPLGFLRADAMMGRARVLTQLERTDESIAIYREIMEQRFEPIVLQDPMVRGQVDRTISLVNSMRQRFLSQISIGGLARIELSRLGVDVEAEYPLTKQADEEPAGNS
ncbi:MAG: hypothetical protein ACFCU1_07690 [Sumerlaeia bacterium]